MRPRDRRKIRVMASLIESGSVVQLFATPIWSFKPKNAVLLAERLGARLEELRARSSASANRSSDVWQSAPTLHELQEFSELVTLVGEASRAVQALLAYEGTLAITGMWGNIGGHGNPLHDHTHPNNLLSGVFYVQNDEGAGDTAFKDPRPQTRVIRPRVVKDTPFNSAEFRYRGSPGSLIVFPAWLEHGVEPNRASRERMTVAFNLMVKGPFGERELLAYSGAGD